MSEARPPQILVAGIGNAFLRDDGFGGQVAKGLEKRELPEGVIVFDFGTGGLDLAYEVMRGYDALVLVDISRQGEAPGTLYVMEPDRRTWAAGSRTARRSTRTAMDPQTVLRFVKAIGGWPGKVVIGLRARVRRGDGLGPLGGGRGRGGRGRRARARAGGGAGKDAAYVKEHCDARALASSSAVVETVERHAAGRRVTAVDMTIGALRQVVPESLEFYFEIVSRTRSVRARARSEHRGRRALRCEVCGNEWELDVPVFRCPGARAPAWRCSSGEELEVESIEIEEEEACTAPRCGWPRTHWTRTPRSREANRADFDHAGVKRGQPDERARCGQDDAAGVRLLA